MKVAIYANYGVLAHEKTCVYSVVPVETSVVSEKVTVEIPNEFEPYETQTGEIAMHVPGSRYPYLFAHILNTGKNGQPVLSWYEDYGNKIHVHVLEVID